MATTPGNAEVLARNAAAIYANAEQSLIERMAEYVAKGVESPQWIAESLITIRKFRSVAEGIAAQAKAATMREVVADAVAALEYGYRSAAIELGTGLAEQIPGKSSQSVAALAAQMARVTDQASFDLIRSSNEALTEVIRVAAQPAIVGVESPAEAAQKALTVFARRGITGVPYANGRTFRIEHYVETSMRTQLMNVALEGHELKMRRDGYDLVQISDVAQECKWCRPFEGKVLALDGGAGPREIDGHRFTVTATLQVARDSGLFHPNCRHVFRAFLPGVSEVKRQSDTADPKGEALRSRQRYLERNLRAAKRVEAAAITPAEKRAARAAVTAQRTKLTAHIEDNGLKRVRARESIGGQFAPVTRAQ